MAKETDIKVIKRARAELIKPNYAAMNGEDAYEMKEAFYKAAEGLRTLRETLEALLVVAPAGPQREAVQAELVFVSRAENEFDKSCLGRIL